MTLDEHPLGAAASRRRRHADQMLRAAAPDMLAALKAALDDFGPDFAGPTIDMMRAAIAKAEGNA